MNKKEYNSLAVVSLFRRLTVLNLQLEATEFQLEKLLEGYAELVEACETEAGFRKEEPNELVKKCRAQINKIAPEPKDL